MTAVVARVGAELRRRWRPSLVLAVLLGVVGGITIAAFAGARRTSTSFDRMIEATDGWDVQINPDLGSDTALDLDAVAALPEVAAISRGAGMPLFTPDAQGQADFAYPVYALAAMDDTSFVDHHRPLLGDGRLPDPARPDEILLGPNVADDLGVGAGDVVELAYLPLAAIEAAERAGTASGPPPVELLTFTVAGVGVQQQNIVVDEAFANEVLLLTPAFYASRAEDASFIAVQVSLGDGADDLASFRAGVEALAPGEAIEFQTLARIGATVDRAVRPQVVALMLFGLAAAAAGLLVLAQALARQLAFDGADADALRAIGMTRRQLLAVAIVRVLAVGVVGGAAAVVVAIALSGRAPVGPARAAEPSPGLDLNATYLLLGAIAIPILLVAVLAVPLWRAGVNGDFRATGRSSFAGARLAAAGAGPVPVVGVGMAVRPLLLGVTGVLAGLIGALVFASGLSGLLDSPPHYGWAWDHLIEASGDIPVDVQRTTLAAFTDSDQVDGVAMLWYDRLVLGGEPLPAIGIERLKGDVHPTVVDGRAPVADTEIALGSRDLARLDVNIGDTVIATTTEGDDGSLDVVGQAVYPGLGTYPGADRTELGRGALVTVDALRRLGAGFDARSLAVTYAPGVDADAVATELLGDIELTVGAGLLPRSAQQPGDVVSLERVRNVPLVLAGLFAVLAAAGLTHGLIGSVRRRRRDLAVLSALGFTRRQVVGAVAWQAATIAIVALAVAMPLGVVAGRQAWTLLADGLGIPPAPRVPLAALGVVAAATLVVALTVATVPARRAAGLRPATVLRAE